MSISSNTVPKDSGDWFSQMSRRMRLLERHRHSPSMDDTLDLVNTSAEVVQSVSAGFSFNNPVAITDGVWAQFTVNIQKITSDLASNANGNITNLGMGFFLPQWQPAIITAMVSSASGQIVHGYYDTAGQLVVAAMLPNIDTSHTGVWAVGTTISFGATYILKSTLAV